ncbi:MAG: thiamine-phosphate kinase [Alphaproteobacteria bacterium]|nr:thiamine-phosphate kinase [Alphaproteobacteria bacterium]
MSQVASRPPPEASPRQGLGETSLGEFGRIARYFAPLAASMPGAAGLKDDVATLALPPGQLLVAKTDTIVDTVHLIGDEPPELVARKALRVNLSDLAAKGARPLGYLLSLSLPVSVDDRWVERFAQGLAADQAEFGLGLLGGDSDRTPGPFVVTVAMLGTVAASRIPRRGDAQAGDDIYVSGTIGDGALGLKAVRGQLPGLSADAQAFLADRYRLPRPRLKLGQALGGIVHAAMDVSDGLVGDLAHICKHSGLGATLRWEDVPLSPAARQAVAADPALRETVLGGGDDYELLLTAAPDDGPRILAIAREAGVPLTRIGAMQRGADVRVVDAQGRNATPKVGGYTHT